MVYKYTCTIFTKKLIKVTNDISGGLLLNK